MTDYDDRHSQHQIFVEYLAALVCSMEVVEHVDNPVGFLRSCAELVKVRLPGWLRLLVHALSSSHVHFFLFGFVFSLAVIFSSRRLRAHLSLISLR